MTHPNDAPDTTAGEQTQDAASSDKYTHTGLNLVGIHEPETSFEPVGQGQYEQRELPGFYTIGTEIDGVFVPLVRIKAGKLLQQIEAAKSADKSGKPSSE